jgi:hypothetical protein
MRKITRGAAALVVATAAVAAFGTGSAHASGTTVHGCPSGAVCIYPENASILTSTPTTFLYSYGPHNLSNQFGYHDVFNNQYGTNASAQLCTGYNGVNCIVTIQQSGNGVYDLTRINSIVLNRP